MCLVRACYDHGIKPACRFFYLQDWMAEQGPSLRGLLVDEMELRQVKWILAYGDVADMAIGELLARKYDVVGERSEYELTLFRLRDGRSER